MASQFCPVCNTEVFRTETIGNGITYDCPRCGRWMIESANGEQLLELDLLNRFLGANDALSMRKRARLSHAIRRMQDCQRFITVNVGIINDWSLEDDIPNARELLENLVLWVGDRQLSPDAWMRIKFDEVSAWMGAPLTKDRGEIVRWLFQHKEVRNALESEEWNKRERAENSIDAATVRAGMIKDWENRYRNTIVDNVRLTLAGWSVYDDIKRRSSSSNIVFMAMKFGDQQLDAVVDDVFRPAVAAAGFDLRKLTDVQGAGLIDDQIEVGLRRARLVIADLTHGNRGAYWEAGFAEALGRPVIYACRKDAWDRCDGDNERLVHFDTNHRHTLIWDPQDLASARSRLTNMIRATLPGEAKMADS